MAEKRETHQSVDRALKLLLAFIPHNNPMSAKQLSDIFGLHLSTTSRLLKVLKENNFLQMDPKTREYTLGWSILRLNTALIQSLKTQMIVAAKPFIDDLCLKIGDTVSLEVLSGDHTVLAYSVNGPQLVQISFSVGDSLPMHVAAGAKAILAFSDEQMIEATLSKQMEKYTDNTIIDPTEIRRQLKEIKRTGLAFDNGERDINVQAIGTPIFDFSQKPIAALVVAALTSRMAEHIEAGVPELLKKTAEKISRNLFYQTDK